MMASTFAKHYIAFTREINNWGFGALALQLRISKPSGRYGDVGTENAQTAAARVLYENTWNICRNGA